jgi:chromate transporter
MLHATSRKSAIKPTIVPIATPSLSQAPIVSFREALAVWAKIGVLSFGGPAAQIALMHRELVERRNWVDQERFLHALNYCMLLPGPEAQQLAVYIGWLLHKSKGGIAAGVLFVLPGFVSILGLSLLYVTFGQAMPVLAAMFALKAAVLAVVIQALWRLSRRALTDRPSRLIALCAFAGLYLFAVPFAALIAGAAAVGAINSARQTAHAPSAEGEKQASGAAVETPSPPPSVLERMATSSQLAHTLPSRSRAVRVIVLCAALWCAPLVLAWLLGGPSSVYWQQGVFFSQTAVVTFGGAYAVLAHVAQRVVHGYHWLTPVQMLDGLGMAETTPGPLILVLQFVGFIAAYRNPGTLHPLAAGILGAVLTVWVTFVPCFLWIFLGAPYIERLRQNLRLQAALRAVTACVVGVIAHLSLWYSTHVLFARHHTIRLGPATCLVPSLTSADLAAWLLMGIAMGCLFVFKWSLGRTLCLSIALALALFSLRALT